MVVGFDNSDSDVGGNNGKIAHFSASGAPLWESEEALQCTSVKVNAQNAEGGSYLAFQYSSAIAGGFYDASGNVTSFVTFPNLAWWNSSLSFNAKPVQDSSGNAYLASIPGFLPPSGPDSEPMLRKTLADGSLAWTQSLGHVELWILGTDGLNHLYLAGTNGDFSQYNFDGNLIWATNYGSPAVALVVQAQINRFLSFADGSVARLAPDSSPQFGRRPVLRADRPGLGGYTSESFRLTLTSDPQTVWQILFSTNLTDWEPVGWVTNVSGEVQFTDPNAANFPQRYYKATP